MRDGGKGRPEDISVSCTQSEGCGLCRAVPDSLQHSDGTFGTCLKYRGGVWCFLSHCCSSLHMPSPPPLHGSGEQGDMAEVPGIGDIKFYSARLKVSPNFQLFQQSSLHSPFLMLAYLTAEGLWWMMLKSNKQSVYICFPLSTGNQHTLHPVFHVFWEKIPFGLPTLESSGVWLMCTHTSIFIVCCERFPDLKHSSSRLLPLST